MPVSENDIRRQIREHYSPQPATILGKIESVDRESRTCTVDNDGAKMYGVRLQCVTDGSSGILVTPKAGAMALIADIEGSGDWMVVQSSEVEWIEIVLDEYKITADKDQVVFHEGTDGMVKLAEMVNWMEKVHADLTALSGLLADTPVAGGGVPLGVVFTPTTPAPTKQMFEDTKIKH